MSANPQPDPALDAEFLALDGYWEALCQGESLIPPNGLPAADLDGGFAALRLLHEVRLLADADTTWDEPTRTHHSAPPAAPVVLPPGTKLGEYVLGEELDRGGMGVIYCARNPHLPGQEVAVKVLTPDRSADPRHVQRFEQEMAALSRLKHPNLVSALTAGREGGNLYLVMERLEGKSLHDFVLREGSQDPIRACEIARDIAAGLEYAHRNGIVHRDIKPANILLGVEGRVTILDFGLALLGDGAATGSGAIMGTPGYLSPEQERDAHSADARSDLYGLGGVLYWLLTARLPSAALGARPPRRVREARPDVPPNVAEIVDRLLAEKRQDRFPTAEAVIAALTAVLRPQRRRPSLRVLMTVAAAVVTVVVLPAVVWSPWAEDRGSAATGSSGTVPATPGPVQFEPLRVTTLNVNHFEVIGKSAVPRGVLGEVSFAAALGDQVTIEAKLSRRAYAYILAFRADGEVELCYPEDEDRAPELTDKPRYPSVSRGDRFTLAEGAGLWVFAVVASEQPLPPYRGFQPPVWKSEPVEAGTVWWDDGEWVDALTVAGSTRGDRAKGTQVPGQSAVVRVTNALKGTGAYVSAAVGFAVRPR